MDGGGGGGDDDDEHEDAAATVDAVAAVLVLVQSGNWGDEGVEELPVPALEDSTLCW